MIKKLTIEEAVKIGGKELAEGEAILKWLNNILEKYIKTELQGKKILKKSASLYFLPEETAELTEVHLFLEFPQSSAAPHVTQAYPFSI